MSFWEAMVLLRVVLSWEVEMKCPDKRGTMASNNGEGPLSPCRCDPDPAV